MKQKLRCPRCKHIIAEADDGQITSKNTEFVLKGDSRVRCPTCGATLRVRGDMNGGVMFQLEGHVTP